MAHRRCAINISVNGVHGVWTKWRKAMQKVPEWKGAGGRLWDSCEARRKSRRPTATVGGEAAPVGKKLRVAGSEGPVRRGIGALRI